MAFAVFTINLVILIASIKFYRYLYCGKAKQEKKRNTVYKEIFLGIIDGFKEQHEIGR